MSSEEIGMCALYEKLTSQIKEREEVYPALLEVITPLCTSHEVIESLMEVSASSSLPTNERQNLLFDPKSDFQAHFLPDKTMLISLQFDPNNER